MVFDPHDITSDPYEILGVPRTASLEEIRRAYAVLVRRYPPQQEPRMFQKVRRAYEILSDPQKRAEFDSRTQLGGEIERLIDEFVALAEVQNWPAAIGVLKRLLALAPDFHDAWLALARCYQELGDTDAAIDVLVKLTRRAQDEPDHWVSLGHMYMSKAVNEPNGVNILAARDAFQRAASLDSRHWAAHQWLATTYLVLDQYDDALEWAERALDIAESPLVVLESYVLMGEAYSRSGKPYRVREIAEEMRERWEDEPELLPRFAERFAQIGREWAERGDQRTAQAFFQAASILDPSFRERVQGLGGFNAPPGGGVAGTGGYGSVSAQRPDDYAGCAGCAVVLGLTLVGGAIFGPPGAIVGFFIGLAALGKKE